jgi:hypothetical protein
MFVSVFVFFSFFNNMQLINTVSLKLSTVLYIFGSDSNGSPHYKYECSSLVGVPGWGSHVLVSGPQCLNNPISKVVTHSGL